MPPQYEKRTVLTAPASDSLISVHAITSLALLISLYIDWGYFSVLLPNTIVELLTEICSVGTEH